MSRPPPPRPATYFDALYGRSADPWRYRTSPYEARKRALTVACLDARRYRDAFEPACSNGELSAALAQHCDRLLAADASGTAVRLARERLAGLAHVTVRVADLPADWPDGPFDLIVLSEFAYYLPEADLLHLVARARDTLTPDGTLIACHWRWPIDGCERVGDAVHAQLHAGLGLPHVLALVEADFRIDVWSSVPGAASREGLRPAAGAAGPAR